MVKKKKTLLKVYHRFLDESGDTTFYGKKRRIIVGDRGVSKTFILGMVKFRTKLDTIREQIIKMQHEITEDDFYKDIPSIKKKVNKGGYFFHAKDDIPEVREKFLRYIKTLNCSFEAVVARKLPDLYDFDSYGKAGWPNYYGENNPLTNKNKISPLSH